ncbi:MAG: zf-HC2 domain-containing protein [Pseudomonadota bacterium]
MTTVSDEMLTAYLDGELSDLEQSKIEMALDGDPALRARLDALEIPDDLLKSAFDNALSAAPAVPEFEIQRNTRGMKAPLGIAAALALGLVVGGFLATDSGDETGSDWKLAVANYQALYVHETLAATDLDADAAEQTLERLSAQVGRDLSELGIVDGLDFRRAQLLGFEDAPLVQAAYLSDDQLPFAICVMPVETSDYRPRSEHLSGLAAAHWVEDGFGFLVIGGNSLSVVSDIAEDVSERL